MDQFTNSQRQIASNIFRNYQLMKLNFDAVDQAFSPLVLAGHTDGELKNFNQTLININRALQSVKNWMDKSQGFGPMGPMFPGFFN